MKKIQFIIMILILVSTLALTNNSVNAQGGPGTLNGTPIPADNTTSSSATVPLDGGLSILLLAAGTFLGAKKVKHSYIAL